MKIKLLLLAGIGFVPSILLAQTTPYLYNRGVMSVVSTASGAPTATTLYIGGDFIAGYDPAAPATKSCLVTLKNTRTKLTGNFFHGLNSGAVTATSANSNVFTFANGDKSEFVFEGSAAQSIKFATGSTYQPHLKGQNYINFPRLVITNQNHVTQIPELASQAQTLRLNRGRFILDSRRSVAADFPNLSGRDINHFTMLSHFMVVSGDANAISNDNDALVANPASVTSHNLFGAVQVNLELDLPSAKNHSEIEKSGRSLVGMGSPFKSMLSDHFFWNFLLVPKNESVIGGDPNNPFDNLAVGMGTGNTVTDTHFSLNAGQGFVVGIDLREPENSDTGLSNYLDLHSRYQSIDDVNQRPNFDDRVKSKYQFSRFGDFFTNRNNVRRYSNAANTIGQKNAALPDAVEGLGANVMADVAYKGEVLNHTNITNLTINKGYNYFSNPYTVPLDLSNIVEGNGGNWGVNADVPTNASRDVSNAVWVLDPTARGSGSFYIADPSYIGKDKHPGNKRIVVNAPYRVMRPIAGTVPDQSYDSGLDNNPNVLAPLQMFVLYSPNGGAALTIPASARKIDGNSYFLRSATDNKKEELQDDFLFSVSDSKTLGVDRTAIAIRTPQDIMTSAKYESLQKIITKISGGEEPSKVRTVLDVGSVEQGGSSVLYTQNEKGTAFESNVLGVSTSVDHHTIPLYLTPSTKDQDIVITVDRLYTAERVKGIILHDKITNKEVDLLTNPTYKTTSKATNTKDRFTLKFVFNRNTTGIEDGNNSSEGKSITSYYQNGTLTVAGFDDVDYGSVISVYDLQGRMLCQAKVDDTVVQINEAFVSGAYIVKVIGNRSYASKFLVR